MARVHGKRNNIDGILTVSVYENTTHLMGGLVAAALFGCCCWLALAGFARFGLDDEIDDDSSDNEDDQEEKPDGALDDHFLDLRGNTFEFDSVDYVEDADGWRFVPNSFIIDGAIW